MADRRIIGLAVAAGLAVIILSGVDLDPRTPILPEDCGELEPTSRGVTCFKVPVEGATLAVTVIHEGEPLERAPLLVIPPIPGEVPSAQLARYAQSPLIDDLDLVLVDPRGAGRSEPVLDCPDLQADPSSLELLERCREDLIDANADLIGPGTDTTVTDLMAVREALGRGRPWSRWHVAASAYGTQVAQRLARVDRSGIDSLVLASAIPGSVPAFTASASSFAPALDGLTALCEQDRRCSRYGSTTAAIFRTVSRLEDAPEPLEVPRPDGPGEIISVDGAEARGAFWRALRDESLVRVLPWAAGRIDDAASEFGLEADGRETLAALEAATGDGSTVSLPLFWTLVCSEQLPIADPSAVSALYSATPELVAPLPPQTACEVWNVPRSIPPEPEAEIGAATLVLSSPTDPAARADWAVEIADGIDDAVVVGRFSQAWSPVAGSCDSELISTFVRSPSDIDDVGCNARSIDFVTMPVPIGGAAYQSLVGLAGPISMLVFGTLLAAGFSVWTLSGPSITARSVWVATVGLLLAFTVAAAAVLTSADAGYRLLAQPAALWPVFVLPWVVNVGAMLGVFLAGRAAWQARIRRPWPARYLVLAFGVAIASLGAVLAGLVPGA